MTGPRISGTVVYSRRFSSHILITVATNFALAFLGLLTGTLAARLLGPEGRGQLAAIQTWPTLIAAVAMLGLPEALVYYSAREPKDGGTYLGSAVALASVSSLVFVIGGYVVMPVMLLTQPPEIVSAARWYLLLVPLYALVGMLVHPLRGRNDLIVWNAARITPTVGWLVVLVLAWFFHRASAAFVAASYLIALAVTFFPLAYTVSRRVPGPFLPRVNNWGRMLRYGFASLLSSAPQLLNLRLDQMVIATLLPAHALGFYVVATAWGGAVQPLLGALAAVLLPQVASQAAHTQKYELLAQGSRRGVLSAAVTAIALMGLTPWGLPFVFGSDFVPAIPAALLLVLASGVTGLNLIIEEGVRGLGRPGAVVRAELAGLAVTGASLVLLLKSFELIGVAVAVLFGSSTITLVLVVQAKGLIRASLADLLCPNVQQFRSGWRQLRQLVTVTK